VPATSTFLWRPRVDDIRSSAASSNSSASLESLPLAVTDANACAYAHSSTAEQPAEAGGQQQPLEQLAAAPLQHNPEAGALSTSLTSWASSSCSVEALPPVQAGADGVGAAAGACCCWHASHIRRCLLSPELLYLFLGCFCRLLCSGKCICRRLHHEQQQLSSSILSIVNNNAAPQDVQLCDVPPGSSLDNACESFHRCSGQNCACSFPQHQTRLRHHWREMNSTDFDSFPGLKQAQVACNLRNAISYLHTTARCFPSLGGHTFSFGCRCYRLEAASAQTSCSDVPVYIAYL